MQSLTRHIVSAAYLLLLYAVLAGLTDAQEAEPPFATDIETGVAFGTTNEGLQRLFDTAVAKANGNLVQFTPSMKVLVEGGGYANAWIETQPMGGEMFAKRNVQVALNNQIVFMLGQRQDGRLPGMVIAGDTVIANGWDENPREGYVWIPKHDLAASFEMFQGYCNLRCMWYGVFTQEMADAFIKHHLLNPEEFWTPVPLVSIAAGEPLFRSNDRNDWSGQPQGLTYQRAIGILRSGRTRVIDWTNQTPPRFEPHHSTSRTPCRRKRGSTAG